MRIGSLFSGAGGLDMAVEEVFGGEVIWQAEVDKAASKVLAYRFPCAPNLGDITQIDWKTVEPVDVLCGGFPCQDVSAAGKRAGIKAGTRSGLWSVFADAIDQLRPPLVVIENVRGLLSAQAHRNVESDQAVVGDGSDRPVLRALGAVLGDLADLGYDTQWTTVAASDIGAPHRRERVFILATDAERGSGAWFPKSRGDSETDRQGRQTVLPGGLGNPATDTGYGNESQRPRSTGREDGQRSSVGRELGQCGAEPGLELLPTPCAQQSGNSPENHLAKKPGRKVVTDLAILVENGLLESGGALLPTPQAHDSQGPKTSAQVATMRAKGYGVRNLNETAVHELLPTPTCQDGANTAGPSQFERNSLPLNAVATLLPTPSLSDTKTPRRGEQLTATIATGIHTLNLSDAIEHQHGRDSSHQAWGKYEPAIRRWEQINGPAPSPTEPNKNGNPRLSAAFSEWMMGWPPGWVTDPDIGISRNDQLKIVGNGVCPQQAAAALSYLLTVAEVAA